jgi:TRAP-type C4-dicarboxylate transport system substrate-binding protein
MVRTGLLKVLVGLCIMLGIITVLPLTVVAQTSEKPIELKYAHFLPAGSYAVEHAVNAWLDQIDNATNGRVKITRYLSQTLVKAADSWEAVDAAGYISGATIIISGGLIHFSKKTKSNTN